MKDIRLSAGGETYRFNNDDNRTVTINFADPNILQRFEAAADQIEKIQTKYAAQSATADTLTAVDKEIKKIIDEAFNAPVSAAAFGSASVMAPTADGRTAFEEVMEFFAAEIPVQVKKATAQLTAREQAKAIKIDPESISSYAAPKPTASTMTPEQIEALKAVGLL